MDMNKFEYAEIKNSELPQSWKTQTALNELKDFLQKNWNLRSSFYNDGESERKQQFIEFIGSQGIKTKSYIGTIVFKGEQLNIFPKMFRTNSHDTNTDQLSTKHLINNLIKWIEYSNKTDHPFLNISSELNDFENLKELFITLYINYVTSVIGNANYFRYINNTEDERNIKGVFDLKDYLTRKVPSGQSHSFRCTYSKFEFDNKVNQIIKYTCKQLYKSTTVNNQRKLRMIISRLDEVSDVPISPHDCEVIRLVNIHKNYRIIISMSKMFLLNKFSGYDIDTNETFCFLFPMPLLFEAFIGGFIKEFLSNHGGIVKLQESKKRLVDRIVFGESTCGPSFTMRHDILAKFEGKIFILDTKYKELSRFEGNPRLATSITEEVTQADLYQMITYAWKRGANDIYLLYPMYRFEYKESELPYAICESPTGKIAIHFVRIPFIFEDDEDKIKKQIEDIIRKIFKVP